MPMEVLGMLKRTSRVMSVALLALLGLFVAFLAGFRVQQFTAFHAFLVGLAAMWFGVTALVAKGETTKWKRRIFIGSLLGGFLFLLFGVLR